MERITFVPNVPQQLALKDRQGRIVAGRRGDQVRYTLGDGRMMVVNMEVASKINLLEIQDHEHFCICKRWNGKRGQPVHWDVWRTPAAEKTRAREELEAPETDLECQLRQSIAAVQNSVHLVPKLEGASASPPAPQGEADRPVSSDSEIAQHAPTSGSPANDERITPGEGRLVDVEQVRTTQPSWAQVLQSQTEALTDVYAVSRAE